MKDFDQNILPHFDAGYSSQGSPLPRRMVYENGVTPEEQPTAKPAEAPPTPDLDINNPDFDNKHFSREKKASFQEKNLDNTLIAILNQIPNLKENQRQYNTLKNEFSTGLIQKLETHKESIAQVFEKQYPAFANRIRTSSGQALWTAFAASLSTLNCTSIGLEHDLARDVTRFKFYAGNKEIVFPQSDIAIHYAPQGLREAATAGTEQIREGKDFIVPEETAKEQYSNRIKHLELMQSQGIAPQAGDTVLINRYGTILKGTYDGGQKLFLTTNKTPLWFIAGDKVTFYPKNPERVADQTSVTIDGQLYPIIRQIDLPAGSKYLDIAKAILTDTVSQGATLNGTKILDDHHCAQAVASGINATEYAYLLKTAHEALPQGSRLPIIIPAKKTARAMAIRSAKERQTQAVRETERRATQSRESALSDSAAIKTIRSVLTPEQHIKLEDLVASYEQRLKGLDSKSKQFQDIWEDFWDEIDDFYPEAGIHRKVGKNVYEAMKAGKDSPAWKEMWLDNPTAQKIVSTVRAYPQIFGKLNDNDIRHKVWTLVYDIGAGDSFDSEDIIKVFGIQLPAEITYDDMLGLAATSVKTSGPLEVRRKEAVLYATAIERLGNDIWHLDTGKSGASYVSRQHEKLPETNRYTEDLSSLITLLHVDKSTPIKKESENRYSSLIEKHGAELQIQISKAGTGQRITVWDPQSKTKLYDEFDNWRVDIEDHVEPINAILSTGPKSAVGQKPGEKMESVELRGTPTYYSISKLETLNQSVPGIPISELHAAGKKGSSRFGVKIDNLENTLTRGMQMMLRRLNIYDGAKYVETAENIREIQGNDSALVNLRYRGRDLTLKFENTTAGYNIYLAKGFNQPSSTLTQVHSEWGSLDSVDEAIGNLDKAIGQLPSVAKEMEATGNQKKITVSNKVLADFNKAIETYRKRNNYKPELSLGVSQIMEAIFRTHTFRELQQQNCLKKVKGEKNAYIISELPDVLKKPSQNQAIRDLIYSIRHGGHLGREYVHLTSQSAEKARESVNLQARHENLLKKIFAYGLTDYDLEGRKLTMQDTSAGREAVSYSSKDQYFKKTSGTAAYNDFLLGVRSFDDEGNEIIDLTKANTRLNEYRRLGLEKLKVLRRDPYYNDLYQRANQLTAERSVDLNNAKSFTDIDLQLIRLGHLNYAEMKEVTQAKEVEQFRQELIAGILKMTPDQTVGPNGEVVKKEQVAATLKQFPVGVLLSMSYVPEKAKKHPDDPSHNLGLHVPIILDVFGSQHAKMALLPGVSGRGLDLVVGLHFTSKDPNWKEQRVIFFGGLSAGATLGPNSSLQSGLSGGIYFKVCKADEKDNFNYYMGIAGTLGFEFSDEKGLVIGGGPALKLIQWELDAQQKYTNSLNEKYTAEGVKAYIDQLSGIYKRGSKASEINNFCQRLKNDAKMKSALALNGQESNEEVLLKFEQYIAVVTEQFIEDFDLPLITGGEVQISVAHGLLFASGAATGNVPLILGSTAAWAVQFLGSLNFNVGARLVSSREQKTSDENISAFTHQDTQKQFDRAFADLPKSAAAKEFFTSGSSTLTTEVEKRTSMEIISVSTETIIEGPSPWNNFNKVLADKNIPLRLKQNSDKTVEVVLLDSKVGNNERMLISPDLVSVKNGRLFLRDPNALSHLYFNQQSRVYPLETSHGATIETVITISDNRYYGGDTFPEEISITRFADNKDTPIIKIKGNKVKEQPKAYVETAIDRSTVQGDLEEMAKALDKTEGEEKETLRENLKQLAKQLYLFRSKKGKTFLSITNDKAQENKDNPDYLDQELHAFYKEFAETKEIDAFNGHEMRQLTLELSTLRYTYLTRGKSTIEKNKAYHDRLRWAEKTLTPYFQARIDELKAKGVTISGTAADLARKATSDLERLDPSMPTINLPKGTSVGIAIGRGERGLHQIIDGSKNEQSPGEYGYIMGKDYTAILRAGCPAEDAAADKKQDYEIALLLLEQLSQLPARADLTKFMESNLARKLASNGGLRFILGQAKYAEIINYYQNKTGNINNPGIKQFMDIVEDIRKAQNEGRETIVVTGENNVKYTVRVLTSIQSGIFNKCGNYSMAVTEDIAIIPPPAGEAVKLFAAGSEGRTTLSTKEYKEFTGFFAGVTAAVALPPGGPTTKEEPKEPAGSGGEVGGSTGSGQGGTVELPDTSGTGTATGSSF